MRCRHARQLLQDRLNDELTAQDAAAIHEHLAVCAACRTEASSLAALRPLLRTVEACEPDAVALQRLSAKVLDQMNAAPNTCHASRSRFRPLARAGAASACTFALGLFTGFVMFSGRAGAVDGARVSAKSPPARAAPVVISKSEVAVQPQEPLTESARTIAAPTTQPSTTKRRLARSPAHAQPPATRERLRPLPLLVVVRVAPPKLGEVIGVPAGNLESRLPDGEIVSPVTQKVVVPLRSTLVPAFVPAAAAPRVQVSAERNEYR